jgi:hypothetical protein
MNSGRTLGVDNGHRRSPAGVVIRGARQTLGGAVTVVGSVGCVAGRLLDGAGTVLDTTAGAVSGTILLVGDILNTTGHVLGSTVVGLGNTLTMAGGMVSGGSFTEAGAAREAAPKAASTGKPKPAKVSTAKRTRPGGATRPAGSPSSS